MRSKSFVLGRYTLHRVIEVIVAILLLYYTSECIVYMICIECQVAISLHILHIAHKQVYFL